MLENELKILGFSPNESKVYLCLINLGKAKAGKIIETTGIQRSVVYSALDELLQRDLVSKSSVKGVAMYSANDPKHLVLEAEEKKTLAQSVAEVIKEKQKESPREIAVYEGEEDMGRVVNANIIGNSGEKIYVLGASRQMFEKLPGPFWRRFHKIRSAENIAYQILTDQSVSNIEQDKIGQLPLSSVKKLPFGAEMPVTFQVCGDQLSIIVSQEDPVLVFNLKSKQTADAIKRYFEYFWKQEVETYVGWEEVDRLVTEEEVSSFKKGKHAYVIGAGYGEGGQEKRIEELFVRYQKLCAQEGVSKQLLFFEKHRAQARGEMAVSKGDLNELRFLPDQYYSPMQIHILPDRTIIYLFSEKPIGMVYWRPEIRNSFKKQFDILWAISKK